MRDEDLARRLRLAEARRALLLNAPEGVLSRLTPAPEEQTLDVRPGPHRYDYVHAFARERADLAELVPAALRAADAGAVLWFSYPKRSSGVPSDLSRDRGWDALLEAGWRGVAQVSVDEVWSAVRWRPRDAAQGGPR